MGIYTGLTVSSDSACEQEASLILALDADRYSVSDSQQQAGVPGAHRYSFIKPSIKPYQCSPNAIGQGASAPCA